MRKLKVDLTLLRMVFERDVDFEAYPQSTYLDFSTGRVIWVWEDDDKAEGLLPEENRQLRLLVQSDPDRFLLIPGLSHADHHDLLCDFLSSDWTDDQQLKEAARSAYFWSIGRWRREVDLIDPGIWYAWLEYKCGRIEDMMHEFLRTRGIEAA